MDNQATADQAVEAAKELARVFVVFYEKLTDGKVDEHTASQLVLMYGRQIMQGNQKEA